MTTQHSEEPRDLATPKLNGQMALVTGANSGIGKGIALAMGKAGANVVVNYVANEEAANEVVDQAVTGIGRIR